MAVKLYAGIGSRSTPNEVIGQMELFASVAAHRGWTLRSGAAPGADSAFERGCDSAVGSKEIFLPSPNFFNHSSSLCHPTDDAQKLAAEIHPVWRQLSPIPRLLIARNMQQILGVDLNEPVRCVVCWTPDGCEDFKSYSRNTGGTGSAIALASKRGIPVFNLNNTDRYLDAVEFMLGDGLVPDAKSLITF
jgi:hypothetical protein